MKLRILSSLFVLCLLTPTSHADIESFDSKAFGEAMRCVDLHRTAQKEIDFVISRIQASDVPKKVKKKAISVHEENWEWHERAWRAVAGYQQHLLNEASVSIHEVSDQFTDDRKEFMESVRVRSASFPESYPETMEDRAEWDLYYQKQAIDCFKSVYPPCREHQQCLR